MNGFDDCGEALARASAFVVLLRIIYSPSAGGERPKRIGWWNTTDDGVVHLSFY